jgi:carboxymethylenebutenolidase
VSAKLLTPGWPALAVCLLAISACCPSEALSAHSDAGVRQVQSHFVSGRKRIACEIFLPKTSGRHPAVLVLYGGSGLTQRPEALRGYSSSLADHGYVALLPHYFDRTHTQTMEKANRARFALWRRTISDAITFAAKRPEVDPDAIGVVGFSLGSYLGLAEAAQDDRVKAVSEYYGGISEYFPSRVRKMPAVLILHGDADSTVPVSKAYALDKFLRRLGAPEEIKIYPGLEHGFDSDQSASEDAWRRTLSFFEQYVKPGEDKRPSSSR